MQQINFAMIGHGFMGKAHSYALLVTPFFFRQGVELVRKVVVGHREAAVKQAAEAFGWQEYSTDWRKAVRRPDVDAVAIVTPPNTHAEIAAAAADAGKHIFCEKPFTVTVDEAERALDAVQKAGVKHMLGFQVNEACHPYIAQWWPPGHGIGYQNTFVNQYADFVQAIVEDSKPEPGFEAGLENQKVLDAVTRSIADDGWTDVG